MNTDFHQAGCSESLIVRPQQYVYGCDGTIIPDFRDVDRPINIFVVATAVVGNKLLQAYREIDGNFVLIKDLREMEPAFENVISTYDSSGNALVLIQIYSGPNPLVGSPISFFIGYRLSDLSGPIHYALPFTLNQGITPKALKDLLQSQPITPMDTHWTVTVVGAD